MRCFLPSIRNSFQAGLLALAILPWACHKKQTASAPVPPPLPAASKPEPVPSPLPTEIPSLPEPPSFFDVGEKYFDAGDYANAAQAYQTYLRSSASSPDQDRALFRLALTRALPGSPVRDLPQAMSLLRQLVTRFPQSSLRPQAESLLGLQGEIDKLQTDVGKKDDRIRELTQELERLKQIDMQRRPTGSP
jgi:tetratricopeptide (TPR) repeat protein